MRAETRGESLLGVQVGRKQGTYGPVSQERGLSPADPKGQHCHSIFEAPKVLRACLNPLELL